MTILSVPRKRAQVVAKEDGVLYPQVISIMHTGTVFLSRPFSERDMLLGGRIIHIHEEDKPFEAAEEADVIAVPLRHPSLVYRSWVHRKRNLDRVWNFSFRQMHLLDSLYGDKIVWVPVDLPGLREERWKELLERVGKTDIPVDFDKPLNNWTKGWHPYDSVDLSYLWNFDFIARHYEAP